MLPLLSASLDTWAVDVVGWGFTDAGFATDPSTVLGPQQKREHLYAFWKAKVSLAASAGLDRTHKLQRQSAAAAQPHPGMHLPAAWQLWPSNGTDSGSCGSSCSATALLTQASLQIGRPVAVAGVSLGGAVALDFAVAHPEAVAKLVLVDAQAFTDGLGTLCSLPQWLLLLSIQVC